MDGFEMRDVDSGETTIRVAVGGSGPAVLLLHGFPQTHLMWRDIAPVLAQQFTVVCADLRGYGDSGCPPSGTVQHWAYTKQVMAAELVRVMHALGFDRFAVAGHDRGGRVAYRLALDHPDRVTHLSVLDIVPIDVAWDRADDRLALGFWPWSLLAQPEPLPERLILGDPAAIIDTALSPEWGTPADTFPPDVRQAYLDQLRLPEHVHAICEEYRAAALWDRHHDAESRRAQRIGCPVLVLWSESGPVGTWYADSGGPLAIWRELADDPELVRGRGEKGGHFFPEERPADIAAALAEFFGDELPQVGARDLVRTSFEDDEAWRQVIEAANAENEYGFRAEAAPVEDRAFDGASWQDVRDAVRYSGTHVSVVYVADSSTMSDAERPILVARLGDPDAPGPAVFRCAARQLWSPDSNFVIGNMDWRDFIAAVGDDGVFRGFQH